MNNEDTNMGNYVNHVRKQIEISNSWYTESQFAWAEKESIRRIYDQRFLFNNFISLAMFRLSFYVQNETISGF